MNFINKTEIYEKIFNKKRIDANITEPQSGRGDRDKAPGVQNSGGKDCGEQDKQER